MIFIKTSPNHFQKRGWYFFSLEYPTLPMLPGSTTLYILMTMRVKAPISLSQREKKTYVFNLQLKNIYLLNTYYMETIELRM